jgi:universal stress protein E
LVLKDTEYHSTLRRALFSSADWNLIRTCPAPLLLVKPAEVIEPPRVLAAVDPMHEHDKPADLDRRILAFAEEFCAAIGAELHVAHVFDGAPFAAATATQMPSVAPPAPEITLELMASAQKRHRQALDELVAGEPIPAERVHFGTGKVVDLLPTMADQVGASFAVLGAVARGALKRVFLGSTAEKLLDVLPCDLVVVKPQGFESPVAVPDR